MPQINLNGIKLDYQEFSPENKKFGTIVFMHGRGGNLLSWFQQIPYFSKKYHCAVCNTKVCAQCFEIKLNNHECNENNLKTAQLLKKDST